jgi:DNA-directed RNA polymerase subunit K/omega
MNYKNTNAERTTVTRDTDLLDDKVDGNLFETIVVLSKRSNQISREMKEELTSKLEEFATQTDNLEEVFENREQIEISKFYERLPKPHSIAIQELAEDKIYFRRPEQNA